jgi:sulfatase modifying factor 1
MRSRNQAVGLALVALCAVGCQKVWGFEDFEEGSGGASTGGSGGSTAGAGGTTGGSGGASGSAGSAGAAPCENSSAPVGMVGVRIADGTCMWIDPNEVSRSDYNGFLGSNPTPPTICNWNTSLGAPEKKLGTTPCDGPSEPSDAGSPPEDIPVTCVDWCDAFTYCSAKGKSLCPGTLNAPKKGAWYDICSSNGANSYPYAGAHQSQYCNDSGSSGLAGSGSKTECVTPSGVYDMTGNAGEWLDACAGTAQTELCDVRGGSYLDNASLAACDGSVSVAKETGLPNVGFRCCWSPP